MKAEDGTSGPLCHPLKVWTFQNAHFETEEFINGVRMNNVNLCGHCEEDWFGPSRDQFPEPYRDLLMQTGSHPIIIENAWKAVSILIVEVNEKGAKTANEKEEEGREEEVKLTLMKLTKQQMQAVLAQVKN